MRVLTLTSLLPNSMQPTLGVFVKERIKAMARRVNVKVVAPVPWFPAIRAIPHYFPYSQIDSTERIEGLRVEHPRFVAIPKIGRWVHWLTYLLGASKCVQHHLTHGGFDVIDVHFAYPDGLAGALLGSMTGKPVLISVRGTDIHSLPHDPMLRLLIRFALKRAALIIAVSRALADEVVRLGVPKDKVVVVGNGVDMHMFRPMGRLPARRDLGLPLTGRIVLSVGSMKSLKGFHHIVDAAAALKREGRADGTHFVFVGGPLDCAYARKLRRRIDKLGVADIVTLAGPQPHAELCRWYSAADVFCLASEREGWPNVVMEALACGVPVVATRVWGTPEALPSEQYGILVDEANGDALAHAIHDALGRDWNHEAILEHARSQSWDNVADRVIEHFKRVIQSWPQQ